MKKIKLFVIALFVSFALPKNILALEGDMCMVYENGSEKILTENKALFEDELKQRVAYLNKENGQGYLIRYLYHYKLEVVDSYTDIEKSSQESIEVSNLFDKEEDAIKYFNSINLESPYIKGEYLISPIEISNVINGDIQEKKCSSLDCKIEIAELEKLLDNNQELNYQITVNDILTGDKLSVDYKENGLIKYFNTKEEANTFASSYKPSLDGYNFINNEVILDNVMVPTLKTYLELKGKDTFSTKEEADSLFYEFMREYPKASGSVRKIANGYSTESGSYEFSNKEDALSKIEEITKDTDLEKVSTSLREEKKNTDKESIYSEYNTKEEAESTISKLRNDGYVVDATIEEVSEGITGNVESGTKFDSASRYVFSIVDTNFILIKQGNDHYAVWTEYELTDNEKNTFVETYNLVNSGNSKFDGSTVSISKEDISWIYGFKAHDLSSVGTNWGTYTFTKSGSSIILTCDAKKVSHVIQGYATLKNSKYILSGTKYMEETIWYVDYVKTVYSFSYKIDASVLLDESVTKYKVLSNFEKMGKEVILSYSIDTKFLSKKYRLSYEKYIPVVSEISNIKWEIYRCSYPYGGDGDVEIMPPQTGVSGISFNFYFFAILLVVVSGYKLLKRN